MIHDADEALRSYLAAHLPGGEKQAVSFEAPTADWVAKIKGVTLNLFLYEVTENLDARGGDWAEVRDEAGNVVGLQPPVRRYDLTYVTSAWGGTVADQHELLGHVLRAMPAYDDIPDEYLVGRLEEQALAVRLRVGSLLGVPSLWESLGQTPVTAIGIRVQLPVLPAMLTDIAPAATSMDFGLAGQDGQRGKRPVPSFDEPAGSGELRGSDGKQGKVPAIPTEPLPEPDPALATPEPAGAGKKWTAYRTRETISVKKATKRVDEG